MTVSDDSFALLLLCSHLGMPADRPAALRLLSPTEQAPLLERYGAHLQGLGEVLRGRIPPELERLGAERVGLLLARGGQLAVELESLEAVGVWALTRADEGYPGRLAERLAAAAPPVLFGAGPMALLGSDGVAVAGSRDLDPGGAAFCREVGALAAQRGLALYSGAARGADLEAALAALDEGGTAVGVPADSLLRMMRDRRLGAFVRAGQLTLATPFHPRAGFETARAMARNKVVYCLAQQAYIAASGLETGGTWAGASEAITNGWVPVFVRAGAGAPEGNLELIRLGATAVTTEELRTSGLPESPAAQDLPPATLADEDLSRLEAFLESWRTVAEIAAEFGASQARVRRQLQEALAGGTVLERRGRFKIAPRSLFALE